MKKHFLFFLFLLFTFKSNASHIVGGGFKLSYISGNNYELGFHVYFDEVNATSGLINADLTITPIIFDKANNNVITSVTLTRISSDYFPYADTCMIASLRTRLLVYKANITLDPSIYNSPAGYYITWERCCRSYLITNLQNPDNTGMAFYMEFPPVVNNGSAFRNSSPSLPVLFDTYACISKNFMIDFSNADPDGDSIVYRLTTPMAGWSGPNIGTSNNSEPTPSPAPYPLITWVPGYTANNPMPDSVFHLSPSGQITITPTVQGFFVFAVACEEYRNQQKIGMTIREYRIYVTNCTNLVCLPPPTHVIPDDLNYSIWPSPFEDKIVVFFESTSAVPFTIQIIDATGTVVKQYQIESLPDSKYEIEIETTNLSPGLYFSRISNGAVTLTKPIPKI